MISHDTANIISYIYFLQGPSAEIELVTGKTIRITIDDQYYDKCTEEILYVDYKNLIQMMEVEGRIFIDDGLLSVIVKEKGLLIQSCSNFLLQMSCDVRKPVQHKPAYTPTEES